ncbi:hypothetical protein LZ906_017400 (plasmid) [Paraclostridium ghonii]|nr:hypothetical protein [Paeniclostridium ghonii]
MKTNKTISIDIDTLEEMLEYCDKHKVTFSKLVVEMWEKCKNKD